MEGGRQWKTKEEEEGRIEREGVRGGGRRNRLGGRGEREVVGGGRDWEGGREGVGVERETVEDKGGGRGRGRRKK